MAEADVLATDFSQRASVQLGRVLTFRISYESDVSKAKLIMQDLLTKDERVLTEPSPQVFVQELADSGDD